jgi:alpha-tubulin suppressor-like RCC1 family protein
LFTLGVAVAVSTATGGCQLLDPSTSDAPTGTAAPGHPTGSADTGTATGAEAGPAMQEAGAVETPMPEAGGADDAASPAIPDVGAGTFGVAIAVAAGNQHTCAVTHAGAVLCWGADGNGQLGNGSTLGSAVPVPVSGLVGPASAVAAGADHTCALVTLLGGSTVQCWGRNEHGEVGDGTTVDRPAPVTVAGLPIGVTSIAAGGAHTCALTSAGAVWCWGAGADGQLGNGSTADATTPVMVSSLSGATAIAAGGAHSCAVVSSAVQCWGDDANGQLGVGSTNGSATPVAVTPLGAPATQVCAGNAYTCALTAVGAMCWGYGQYGQLGDSTTSDSPVPVAVATLATSTKAMAGGGEHACALDPGGGAWCWGEDQSGQLGDNGGTDSPVPVSVLGIASGANAIAAGTAHTCAVAGAGRVMCWGWNVSGQLGNGSQSDSAVAVEVLGF